MHNMDGHRGLRFITTCGALLVGIFSAPRVFADNWTTGTAGQITSGTGTRVGIGGFGTTQAQLDVQASNTSREGFIVNQVSTPAIARFRQNGTTKMLLTNAGNLGIGTATPSEKLQIVGNATVSGFINADGGLRVKSTWTMEAPDYVFDTTKYKLMSLADVERFVQTNRHLPEVPSAEEISKNGLDVAQMNLLLLKKVEELTLHLIEQEKRIKELSAKLK